MHKFILMKGLITLLLLPILAYSQIQYNSSLISGGAQDDVAKKIEMDGEGNFFVLGNFTGPATFGTDNFQGGGFSDCYLQKIDANNEIIWTIAIGGPNTDLALTLAIDANNNVWITGKYSGSIDLDPSNNTVNLASDPTSGVDCFLACYSGQTGAYITHKDISSGGILEIRAIKFTENQQVIIGGTFQFTVDFDFSAGTLSKTSFVNSYDGFIANYNADFTSNNWLNILSSGNPALDCVNDFEILNNKIYLTGLVAGTMDIDPGNNTVQLIGATDAFLISYNVNNGNLNWGFKIGGNSLEIGNFVSIINNKVYLNGTINSNNVDFNPGNASNLLSPNGLASPPFVAKYDTLGNYISAYLFDISPSGTYTISEITAAENNEILISGYFKGDIDIDPSIDSVNLSSIGVNNSFFMWVNQSDSLLNYKFIESANENTINDIIFSQSEVFAIGAFENSCIPDQTLTISLDALFDTNKDAFVFNYSPNVTVLNGLFSKDLNLFPNPINEQTIIASSEQLEFDVIDITGKMHGTVSTNSQNEVFNNLPKGAYFAVNIKNNLYIKFVKAD